MSHSDNAEVHSRTLAHVAGLYREVPLPVIVLSAELKTALVERYADLVMRLADVPVARRGDLEEGPRFTASDSEIACTCGITGSSYERPWDGSDASALAFADEVGEATAALVRRTKNHLYAWLYASR